MFQEARASLRERALILEFVSGVSKQRTLPRGCLPELEVSRVFRSAPETVQVQNDERVAIRVRLNGRASKSLPLPVRSRAIGRTAL